jgi:hypothetical protein
MRGVAGKQRTAYYDGFSRETDFAIDGIDAKSSATVCRQAPQPHSGAPKGAGLDGSAVDRSTMRSAVNRIELADRLLRDFGMHRGRGPIIASGYTGNLHHLCGRDRIPRSRAAL